MMAKVKFTAGGIEVCRCEAAKIPSFLWDSAAPQAEARRLKVIIDSGQDPRLVKAEGLAAQQAERYAKAAAVEATRNEAARQGITLADVWQIYVEARKSK